LALADEEKIKEQVRFNTELLKLFVIILVATIGGVISLLLEKIKSGPELVFLIGGMITFSITIGIVRYLHRSTQKLISHGKI
jgi:hypothetical protein